MKNGLLASLICLSYFSTPLFAYEEGLAYFCYAPNGNPSMKLLHIYGEKRTLKNVFGTEKLTRVALNRISSFNVSEVEEEGPFGYDPARYVLAGNGIKITLFIKNNGSGSSAYNFSFGAHVQLGKNLETSEAFLCRKPLEEEEK